MVNYRKLQFRSINDSRVAISRAVGMLRLVTQIQNFLTDKQHITLNQLSDQLGDRFRVRLGFGNAVFFSDPAAVSRVLTLDRSKVATGAARRKLAGMFPAESLLYADGDTHVRMRKAISKAFGESARSFNLQCQFTALALRIENANRVDPTDLIYDYLVEMTSNFILGRAPYQICQDGKQSMASFTGIPTAVVLFPFLRRIPRYRSRFENYRVAQQQLTHRIRCTSDLSDNCFVSALQRQQRAGELTNNEVQDNASFFFLVMIRTLCTLFTNVARTLAVESEWQDRLRRLDVSMERQNGPRLRRAFVKEAIRFSPFAPIYVRRALCDQDIDGFEVKKGEYIVFSPDLIHRREQTFPNPHEFSPSRFLERQRPGSFVPFGGGTRHCIGSGWGIDSIAELLKTLLPIVDFQTDGGHFGHHDFAMHTIFRTPRRRGFSMNIYKGAIESPEFGDKAATLREAV